MAELVFLKLGGSLITDKTRPYTPRLDVLADLALQMATVRSRTPSLRLVLGHGSGSFGHSAAREHHTREGLPAAGRDEASREKYWRGFAEVGYQAALLHHHVMNALHKVGLPAMTFAPSASVLASNGTVTLWETTPIRMALANGIVPVVYGDVVFDEIRGGTILSTEDLFVHLAQQLNPDRILLAGLEAGVWEDFPARTRLVTHLTPTSYEAMRRGIGNAQGVDVTGGMEAKVRQMLSLVQELPETEVRIFSAEAPGNLLRALEGETLGTRITL